MNTYRQNYRPGSLMVALLQSVACCIVFAAIGVLLAL